jgi:hypothetical protein
MTSSKLVLTLALFICIPSVSCRPSISHIIPLSTTLVYLPCCLYAQYVLWLTCL